MEALKSMSNPTLERRRPVLLRLFMKAALWLNLATEQNTCERGRRQSLVNIPQDAAIESEEKLTSVSAPQCCIPRKQRATSIPLASHPPPKKQKQTLEMSEIFFLLRRRKRKRLIFQSISGFRRCRACCCASVRAALLGTRQRSRMMLGEQLTQPSQEPCVRSDCGVKQAE